MELCDIIDLLIFSFFVVIVSGVRLCDGIVARISALSSGCVFLFFVDAVFFGIPDDYLGGIGRYKMKNDKSDLRIFNRDTVKLAAIIAMAVGHIVGYFPFLLNFISNDEARHSAIIAFISFADFAPPILFFFISEGFCHTRSRRKYIIRLLVFTVISQVPYCLMKYGTLSFSTFFGSWNVMVTLLMGLLGIFVWNSRMSVFISKLRVILKALFVIFLDALTILLKSEWTVFGVPIILGFYIFKDKAKARFIWFLSFVLLQQIFFFVSNDFNLLLMIKGGYPIQLIALLLGYFAVTKFYNGEKGKHHALSKWFFYIFYPAHMLVIYLFRKVIKAR